MNEWSLTIFAFNTFDIRVHCADSHDEKETPLVSMQMRATLRGFPRAWRNK